MREGSWQWFLFLTLLCITTQSFFAMMEMACVSFHKVRLQYYLAQGSRSARLLQRLLKRPALLFGATLLSVNISLLLGSECSRRFYEQVGASPFWAPLTQAFLVLIFAEIAPMLAGRRYAEHAVMLGIIPLYLCAYLLRPLVWAIDLLCHGIHKLCGSSLAQELYVNREELQNILEERKEKVSSEDKEDLESVVSRIFSLKTQIASELMSPLSDMLVLPASSTVAHVRQALEKTYTPLIPLFHKDKTHIVGIVHTRDLLRLQDNKRVQESAKSPWFVTESVTILQILKEFRKNNQNLAIVLGKTGTAVGVLSLDKVIDAIFGQNDRWNSLGELVPGFTPVALDRTFPGNTFLWEFKQHYLVDFHYKHAQTLAEAMELALGHVPRQGESVRIDQFELTVEEAGMLSPRLISVRTLRLSS